MFTARTGCLVGVHNRAVARQEGQVLRFCSEPHQQQVARLPIFDARDALQAGLTVKRSLKLALRWGAAVAGDIEMPGADLAGDVNRNAGAVETE